MKIPLLSFAALSLLLSTPIHASEDMAATYQGTCLKFSGEYLLIRYENTCQIDAEISAGEVSLAFYFPEPHYTRVNMTFNTNDTDYGCRQAAADFLQDENYLAMPEVRLNGECVRVFSRTTDDRSGQLTAFSPEAEMVCMQVLGSQEYTCATFPR